MILKIYNMFNELKCTYMDKECFPTESQIDSMNKGGYKFELDNKKITAKKLKEKISERGG